MTRSYLVKSPVHFADFSFFVKVGDILVHDTANGNRMTVYRNGEIAKAVKQTPLGIMAMVKNSFIEEVVVKAAKASAKPIPAPKPAPTPKEDSKPISKTATNWGGTDMSKKKEEPKKRGMTAEDFTTAVKRQKAEPKEVPADEMPERLELRKAKEAQ